MPDYLAFYYWFYRLTVLDSGGHPGDVALERSEIKLLIHRTLYAPPNRFVRNFSISIIKNPGSAARNIRPHQSKGIGAVLSGLNSM